ncbi:hypothetical protein DSM3645_04305 [Blastopirellula marina DSM 3645]|uniref:Putative regulatory protein FmdB zinc ribbon domain-containing protein n=2 Tax=Blastopirellula marina TaxID=124 RepID=A4A2H6_9BACT|nr:hypothetical protein DSM3645_04305 [Blastopirellula marina DSM 3645]
MSEPFKLSLFPKAETVTFPDATMPTYEYECDACQHQFEEFQNLSDDVLTKCPKCKKKKLRRLFSTGGGLIFKGSGFYITDYRSDSYKKSASSDSSSSSSSSGGSSSSESKSSSKSESKPKSSGGSKGSKKSSD